MLRYVHKLKMPKVIILIIFTLERPTDNKQLLGFSSRTDNRFRPLFRIPQCNPKTAQGVFEKKKTYNLRISAFNVVSEMAEALTMLLSQRENFRFTPTSHRQDRLDPDSTVVIQLRSDK